jgi:glycosyltransferase involved in cell wall biosynthesis
MRIGLLIYDSLDTLSGGYLYDRKLVEHLRRQGDQVEVVSLPGRSYLAHLGDNFSPLLARRLKTLPVDLLLQDELNHPSLFWINSRLKGELPYPQVGVVHHLRCQEVEHPSLLRRFYQTVERRYLASVDAFLFNSQTTRQAVAQLRPELPPSAVIYPAGDRFEPTIDPAAIRRRAFRRGPFELLYVGSLIPRKGLHVLLQALQQIGSTLDWRLTISGRSDVDSGYSRKMQRLARQPGLSGRVHFAGAPDDAALARQMENSQLLVVPSFYEGFGIVFLEAMSFGLPVLAAEAGAAPEVVPDGEAGCLVPPGSPHALAQRITELARDRERLAWMSFRARLRYLEMPGWEESMEAARLFLRSLLP